MAGVELSKGGGQDPVRGLPSINPGNVQSLNTETEDQGRLLSSGPSLNNPSFLWQDSAAAKPPWTQSRVMPGQALVSHQVPRKLHWITSKTSIGVSPFRHTG